MQCNESIGFVCMALGFFSVAGVVIVAAEGGFSTKRRPLVVAILGPAVFVVWVLLFKFGKWMVC